MKYLVTLPDSLGMRLVTHFILGLVPSNVDGADSAGGVVPAGTQAGDATLSG